MGFSVKFFQAKQFVLLLSVLFLSNVSAYIGDDSAYPNNNNNPQMSESHMFVDSIEVEGVERIPKETILSYLTFKKGDAVDRNAIDLSLKALFATELFADVNIQVDREIIKVIVKENPVINRIVFEGNKKLKEERLKNELQLRPRVVYTRNKVQKDVERLVEIYRQNGRYAAKIEPSVIELPQNRVDLVYKIDEGKVTEVRRISFLGNKHFSSSTLKEIIKTRESAWWRIMSSDDIYDPHRLEYDKELLREYYLAMGYAEFRIKSAIAELAPEKDGFYISFTIEEGSRYKINKVEVESHIKEIPGETLLKDVYTKVNAWYNAEDVNDTISLLTEKSGEMGYAFVDVKPRTELDRVNKKIDIIYEIGEGPKVFVEKIDIINNFRTLDKVIRREFLLVEGDAFNVSKLKDSKKRLEHVGIFEDVKVDHEEGSKPDQTIIKVDIQEKRTLDFNIAGGFSENEGILGKIELKESNFLGRGQEVGSSVLVSKRSKNFNVSFTEPYFLERDLLAGVDFFHTMTNNCNMNSYDIMSTGGNMRFGYNLADHIEQMWSYGLRRTNIYHIDKSASGFVKGQRKHTVVSEFGHAITFDYRDSRIDPRRGFFVNFSQDIAGAGGNTRYIRFSNSAGFYQPITNDIVLSLTGDLSYIQGIHQKYKDKQGKRKKGKFVDINNRFFLGGDSFRGFETGGIGPRDIFSEDLDALGGRRSSVNTAEIRFPIGLPEELRVSARIFTDVGFLDKAVEKGPGIRSHFKWRASSGVGMTWVTPMGPIRVDVGKPWLKDKFDKKKYVLFGFGTRF